MLKLKNLLDEKTINVKLQGSGDVYAIVDKFDDKKQDYDQVYWKDSDLKKTQKHFKKMGKKYGDMQLIKVDTKGKMIQLESGLMYRAGVKRYGKEGMTKIQSAAGKGAGHAEIGKIKDQYDKKKKKKKSESVTNEKKGDFLSSLFPKSKVAKAIKIAKKMSGNMTGAVKAIEKFFPGMSRHNDVQDALRKYNESIDESAFGLILRNLAKHAAKKAMYDKMKKNKKKGRRESILSVNERTKMRPQVKKLLKQKGYGPIFGAIDDSKRQLKQMRYSKGEIQDTLIDMFGDEDSKILKKIKEALDPYKDFGTDNSWEKEYDLNLGSFVEHYQNFIKFMKKYKEVPDKNKRAWAHAIRKKVGQGMFNGHMSQMRNIMGLLKDGEKFRKLPDKAGWVYENEKSTKLGDLIPEKISGKKFKVKNGWSGNNSHEEDFFDEVEWQLWKMFGDKKDPWNTEDKVKQQVNDFIVSIFDVMDDDEWLDKYTGLNQKAILKHAKSKGLKPIRKPIK